MSKATDIIVRVAEILRFDISNIEKKGGSHYYVVLRSGDNIVRGYVIFTRSYLRNPLKLGINYKYPMLGVRTNILPTTDLIIWVVEDNNCVRCYVAKSSNVFNFCVKHNTIYHNEVTNEYVCNYPVADTRKIYELCKTTLLDFVKEESTEDPSVL
jgi:hypothetical protein